LHRVHEHVVVGEHAELEVSSASGFCAEAGSGEVGASEVEGSAVDGDDLQMHAGAPAHLEAGCSQTSSLREFAGERA
jgi:hypothetical protein